MPVTTSYPGIYIEELQSSANTITAAATSITVFVGYTHPFKTNPVNFGLAPPGMAPLPASTGSIAVQLFSFTDYQTQFGGFFSSDFLSDNMALAVNQFFLNGGTNAYVVGLQASYHSPTAVTPFAAATLTLGNIQFTATEPVDNSHPMTVTISPAKNLPGTADITISYGSIRSETYRKVTLVPTDKQNYIEARVGTPTVPISSLVTVSPLGTSPQPYGASFASASQVQLGFATPIDPTWTTYSAADFTPVFQQDTSLDKITFNLLVLPGVADNEVSSEALSFCERKLAFYIMDPPRNASADGLGGLPLMYDIMESGVIPESKNGALYFPYIKSTDPVTNQPISLPPAGTVAGIYAQTDTNRGVWKAPAGLETTILNTSGVVDSGRMTEMRQGTLNPIGVNCLRTFPGVGTVVFGARTLVSANTSQQQWRYVPVRRMALFLEQTLLQNLTWVIFEPNDTPLWVAITTSIQAFMLGLYNQGAFQGTTPSQAFQVKCDSTTTTQADINNGIVNIIVAFAPLKPAEFVVIQIAQLAGQTQTS